MRVLRVGGLGLRLPQFCYDLAMNQVRICGRTCQFLRDRNMGIKVHAHILLCNLAFSSVHKRRIRTRSYNLSQGSNGIVMIVIKLILLVVPCSRNMLTIRIPKITVEIVFGEHQAFLLLTIQRSSKVQDLDKTCALRFLYR